MPKKQEKDTDELLHELKQEENVAHFIETNEEHLQKMPLHDYLAQLLSQKNRTKSDVIRASGLEVTYAYHIFSGDKNPSRAKLLTLALALELDLKETSRLLHAAHLPQLYVKKSWDSVLIFALTHKKSVMEANLLLDKLGETPLLG